MAAPTARSAVRSSSPVAVPPAARVSPDCRPRTKRFRGTAFQGYHALCELGSRGGNERTLRGKSGHQRARAVGNAHPGKPAGKCHRNDTADGAATRESRTGKVEMVR